MAWNGLPVWDKFAFMICDAIESAEDECAAYFQRYLAKDEKGAPVPWADLVKADREAKFDKQLIENREELEEF